ncbi:hypothetical protein T190_21075 [Sinorhizobium meliloti CCBAU 01290]|nr:hypothetical protein T190_21075 [Sinorhizobium meliloti CCBAU 01290]
MLLCVLPLKGGSAYDIDLRLFRGCDEGRPRDISGGFAFEHRHADVDCRLVSLAVADRPALRQQLDRLTGVRHHVNLRIIGHPHGDAFIPGAGVMTFLLQGTTVRKPPAKRR